MVPVGLYQIAFPLVSFFTSFLLPKVFRITTSQVVGCLILWPLCLQDHQGILPCLQQLALKPSKLVASSALC